MDVPEFAEVYEYECARETELFIPPPARDSSGRLNTRPMAIEELHTFSNDGQLTFIFRWLADLISL
jgi:hypothetical protein